MKPTTLKKIRKRHPRQQEIDAEAAALLIATRERMKGPDARRSSRKSRETKLLPRVLWAPKFASTKLKFDDS